MNHDLTLLGLNQQRCKRVPLMVSWRDRYSPNGVLAGR